MSATPRKESTVVADKVLWLILRFCLLSAEFAFLTFALVFGEGLEEKIEKKVLFFQDTLSHRAQLDERSLPLL